MRGQLLFSFIALHLIVLRFSLNQKLKILATMDDQGAPGILLSLFHNAGGAQQSTTGMDSYAYLQGRWRFELRSSAYPAGALTN